MPHMKHQIQIIKGAGRGKGLGIPTINGAIPRDFPYKHGIYAGWVYTGNKKYPAAIHFGPRPVFDDPKPSLEAHILEQVSDVADTIEIELLTHIRDIQHFATPQKMLAQIQKDIQRIKQLLDI